MLWWMIRACGYADEISHGLDENEKSRINFGVWQQGSGTELKSRIYLFSVFFLIYSAFII